MTKEFKQKLKEVFLKSNEIAGGNQLALFWVFEYAEMDRLKREKINGKSTKGYFRQIRRIQKESRI